MITCREEFTHVLPTMVSVRNLSPRRSNWRFTVSVLPLIFPFQSSFWSNINQIFFPDAPHISVEHPRLETGYGEAKELVCMVHAHPKAKVKLNQMTN